MNKKNAIQSTRNLQIRQDKGYACVYLNGEKIMLGARFGTPEADEAFRQLHIRVLTDPTLSFLNSQQITVDILCCAYLKYAKEHDPSHFSSIKTAVEILLRHFTGQAVDTLDSRSFLFLQGQFVAHGVSRKYCNSLLNHIRAMLRWGAIRKLVSSQVHSEAQLVRALKKGKTSARENPKRQDVPDEIVDRTLPDLLPTIRDSLLLHVEISNKHSR